MSQQHATPATDEAGQLVNGRAESISAIGAVATEGTRVIDPVPALDDLMPPLDRRGRRGTLSNAERDYRNRRNRLAEVLAYLTSVEAALADVRNSNIRLAGELEDARLASGELASNVSYWQRAHDRVSQRHGEDLQLSRRALMTVNALTRLTGLEATSVHLDQTFTPIVYRLGIDPYYAQVNPYTHTVVIGGNGRRETAFRLNLDGTIQALHEMAILTFLGIQRDPKEALSKTAYTLMFQTPPPGDVALPPTPNGPHSRSSYESVAEFMASSRHTAQECPYLGQCKEHIGFSILRQEYKHAEQMLNKPNPGL